EHDVGRVLGDVGGGLDGDADVGGVEGDGVVDAVTEEGDVDAGATGDLDDARLLFRADPGEHGCLWNGGCQFVVAEALELGAGEDLLNLEADVPAHLGGHGAVVAGDDLDGDPEV